MEHLNYCRQMVRQFNERLSVPSIHHAEAQNLIESVTLAAKAEKFLMPHGGLAVDDLEMRALDETAPLNLPHKCIAIEYQADTRTPLGHGQVSAPKRIIFAVQADDVIAVKFVACAAFNGIWYSHPWVAIDRVGALAARHDGRVKFSFRQFNLENYDGVSLGDYRDELTVLLAMLNALACSNVHIERSEPRGHGKRPKAAALPFDAYHVLTIDIPGGSGARSGIGGHRSPREHLRRGHIRRLEEGRRIWVNATVVAAGRGAGVVTKDYAVRRRAQSA